MPYVRYSQFLFQVSIAFIFGYFGLRALMNPDIEAAKWVSQSISGIIELVLPITYFMYMYGIAQITVALSLAVNKLTQYSLPAAATMLIGIVISIGFNEIALRDFVIFTAVVFLYCIKHIHTSDQRDSREDLKNLDSHV